MLFLVAYVTFAQCCPSTQRGQTEGTMTSWRQRMFGPSTAPLVKPSWLAETPLCPWEPLEEERDFTLLELLLLGSIDPDWCKKVKEIFIKEKYDDVDISLNPEPFTGLAPYEPGTLTGRCTMESLRSILWTLSVLQLDSVSLCIDFAGREVPASTMRLLFTVVHSTKDVGLHGLREEVTEQLFHTWTTNSSLKSLGLNGVAGLNNVDQKHLTTCLCSLERFHIYASPIKMGNLVTTVLTPAPTTTNSSPTATKTKIKLRSVYTGLSGDDLRDPARPWIRAEDLLGLEEVEPADLARFVTTLAEFETARAVVTEGQWAALHSIPGGDFFNNQQFKFYPFLN